MSVFVPFHFSVVQQIGASANFGAKILDLNLDDNYYHLRYSIMGKGCITLKNINLAMPEALLARLIYEGHLCAADVKCLDSLSKQRVWQLCLWACKERAGCNKSLQQQDLNRLLRQDLGNRPHESVGLEPGQALVHGPQVTTASNPCGNCEQRCWQWLEQADANVQTDISIGSVDE
ncbi:hypothetical protein MJ923_08880 [Shewanella sp. 3B26]|uniref:Uncharacterized protein n=1 Tax=Shewanella zhuhaiensis TaxID=2919576 RepID=A0AAJ1BGK6_9GAMM|nr:hypothetical protein [Shewanella zhuhaiensis]MCH4294415.1 hypothetical protein [Shewanella zhuhaiensis]